MNVATHPSTKTPEPTEEMVSLPADCPSGLQSYQYTDMKNRKKHPRHRPTHLIAACLRSLVLAFIFSLSPMARAVNPPPDGGYPNNNTAEGDNALLKLTTGNDNTAVGSLGFS